MNDGKFSSRRKPLITGMVIMIETKQRDVARDIAPSPEYIVSGDYRSSAPRGSSPKGPSSRLTVAL